ncbi:hypothetical protein GWI33_003839 [Rhynchophorus ferrugineus]|uniref:Uncharacterized protein n=1 Tax=Rhynchophorus ferrugineus TaxID=354439 RepID=A0A834HR33_RHYFE|nr:hypothetical protein GWI33_003842 [Rhynchophorus ferrugineus]KAF7262930.1 hypothetical protein GWI33_003839 [Rhynchophorus ferrugineus]
MCQFHFNQARLRVLMESALGLFVDTRKGRAIAARCGRPLDIRGIIEFNSKGCLRKAFTEILGRTMPIMPLGGPAKPLDSAVSLSKERRFGSYEEKRVGKTGPFN